MDKKHREAMERLRQAKSPHKGAIAPFQTKPEEIKGIALRNGVEFVRQRK
jgi:hypothetical protein